MALVDYSSSDSESAVEAAPSAAAKRRKISHDKPSDEPALPPLPAAFHDLYASTVRVSTSDDPTLHQGRKRVNPHKAGNWPSHLYVEWHPTPSQRSILTNLLSALKPALSALSVDLTSFLVSDLGAPQPLHISLSRPIVLSTSQKDGFLEELVSCIKTSGVAPFDLAPRGLEWHRTQESARSFLVLRVASAGGGAADGGSGTSPVGHNAASAEKDKEASTTSNQPPQEQQEQNPQLTNLLQRCNTLVKEYNQPPLYAFKANNGDDAFHISIAWSFAAPTPEAKYWTEEIFSHSSLGRMRDEILGLRVHVDGVKAKIGNVVTHVPLPVRGKMG
ncbi:U6 snRNA phosphodiesterase Usb1 [Hypoxylon sp. NC0597]|nr:U6 snRNA phosphodiesterase Usb1 [Hypoxylon sp. NC0597]